MIPNKKIPDFCFEFPKEKKENIFFFQGLNNEEILEQLFEQLINEINTQTTNTIRYDLIDTDTIERPRGGLFYYDFTFDDLGIPKVYDDGSWSFGNSFEGVIGIKSEIKLHKFI